MIVKLWWTGLNILFTMIIVYFLNKTMPSHIHLLDFFVDQTSEFEEKSSDQVKVYQSLVSYSDWRGLVEK